MGTRSGIAISENGIIKAIYCHADGYLEYNGAILNEFYQDSVKVNQLIALGDMSSLGIMIGEIIDFDTRLKYDPVNHYAKQCRFYGRDRGEKDCEFKVFQNRKDFINGIDGEYHYLMEDGVWLVSTGGAWYNLKEKIESIIEEDAE